VFKTPSSTVGPPRTFTVLARTSTSFEGVPDEARRPFSEQVPEETHQDRPAGDGGWPMPHPELRRLLQPVPVWTSSQSDDAESDAD